MVGQKEIVIQGARQNNLKDVYIKIPRDQITVITGVSGSGKSSLAFEVLYGEGKRRFLDALPTFSRSRMEQMKKPDVDFIFGLSPVIAIEQKKGLINPRSTVGTMTDIYDYMRLLYATVGDIKCPYCDETFDMKSSGQIVEAVMSLPKDTQVEFLTPIHKIYGESYDFLFDTIREKGYNKVIVDGKRYDISDGIDIDEFIDHDIKVVVDHYIIDQRIEKSMTNSIETALELICEHVLIVDIISEIDQKIADKFYGAIGCREHHITMANLASHYFAFNNITSSCNTCGGIGTSKKADPRLMIVNHQKSIAEGAFDSSVYNHRGEASFKNFIIHTMAKKYNIDLNMPFCDLSDEAKSLLFYGTKGEKIKIEPIPNNDKRNWILGRTVQFSGFVNQVEHWYRESIRKGNINEAVMEWFRKKMIEFTCPDCQGRKLKKERFNVLIGGINIHEMSWMQMSDLLTFLDQLTFPKRKAHIALPIVDEIRKRVALLVDIGLDYLAIGRRADTISGGEAQRIKLASQISSGLMGMIYVLDEPSIGLHARDSQKVIDILRRLRDLGNTVIVVEHDVETIESADYIVEMGPGPGVHGGTVIEHGCLETIKKSEKSVTGQFLSGRVHIPLPKKRRKQKEGWLKVIGGSENNLKNIEVKLPLHNFVCVSGVSGSGKSTLVNEIIVKKLKSIGDPRVIPGEHKAFSGEEHVKHVINIDQSPIGKNSRSNPATYVGIFDSVRKLFAKLPESKAMNYNITNFSFNSKNSGRCEHCKGEGKIVTKLQFMPDVEIECPICKGQRYKKEILDIKYKDKSIYDILDLSIEEAVAFFEEQKTIHHKLSVLNELGLGYLKLGQPSPTLSGGESQRIKLASELGKIKHGLNNLYILDEPTTGLHLSDIKKLILSLNKLVDKGHSLIVIEHNLEILKMADYIIDLGPEGGKSGGMVVAAGAPEEIIKHKNSITGRYLKTVL